MTTRTYTKCIKNIEQPKSTIASTLMLKLMLSILLILTSIIIPSSSCPIHQKHALLHFKSALTAIYNSTQYVELDSWNSTPDCCSWERVNCSRTGSVTELHLSAVARPLLSFDAISSGILAPLFHIRSLELLDISMNYFEGEIPGDGFGNLTKLLHLEMSMNSFNGSIPRQLFQLTNLRYLDITINYLDGVLSPEVGKLQNLESLHLYENYISGNIPEEIGNLRKLRDFSLQKNRFSGGIPSSIANLTKLESMDLSGNYLSLEIPSSIGRLTNLTFLNLRSNQFTGPIPSSLFKIRTLKELYIGGKGSKQLTWNSRAKVVPRCSLQKISMDSCGISGQIPEWISSQKDLVDLDLRGNKLVGLFPHWLAEMNNIQSIILSDNNLSGSIPPHLFESESLRLLDLSKNNFSGKLPDNVGNAVNIFYLVVSENKFSGVIPNSISKIEELRLLDLSRNKFSGDSLPIFRAKYDLSNNDLSGKIPMNFPEGTEILYLGGNKFSGSLPFNLTKLVNLRVLDLHNSIITGNLLEILPQIPTIEILILRNTSLNGIIPNNISMCTSLRILDLSRNNLTGSIPRQMANLPIMNMSASPNLFSWSIGYMLDKPPLQDSLLDTLQDLIVNWKKSSQCLRNLDLFVLLDLSGNNISGEIPASLGNLKALKQLNISHNKISGNIPLSFGNLEGVESLDVSHNELSGSIPQSLDQLRQLSVLDVSNNMLTGKIPRGGQMDTMNELRYFQNNSGLCGMQINITCPEDIPPSEERDEEGEDLSWIFWEGTWIGFPIGFFSTILIMSYLLNFIQLFKIW